MSQTEEEGKVTCIKVGLLGGEKVGKTYLAHKMIDQSYVEYQPTQECQKFSGNHQKSHESLKLYDFPPLQENTVESIVQGHKFDVMICIFKDSTSFAQLYEFFETISTKGSESNEEFYQYWESLKLIVLVYTNYEEKGKVQTEQLFNILSEEVRNFNPTGMIKEFVLQKDLVNSGELRQLILQRKVAGHMSEELTASQKQTIKTQEQQIKSFRQARSKRMSYSREANLVKNRDFSKSFNVEPQEFGKKSTEEEHIESIDINYINKGGNIIDTKKEAQPVEVNVEQDDQRFDQQQVKVSSPIKINHQEQILLQNKNKAEVIPQDSNKKQAQEIIQKVEQTLQRQESHQKIEPLQHQQANVQASEKIEDVKVLKQEVFIRENSKNPQSVEEQEVNVEKKNHNTEAIYEQKVPTSQKPINIEPSGQQFQVKNDQEEKKNIQKVEENVVIIENPQPQVSRVNQLDQSSYQMVQKQPNQQSPKRKPLGPSSDYVDKKPKKQKQAASESKSCSCQIM